MRTMAIRPAGRHGAVLVGLALLAAGCIGTGEPGASPADSAAISPPPSTAESPPPNSSPSPSALPETLAAKTWVANLAGGPVAGTLDGRYRLSIPPDEVGLTAAEFRVVSVIYTKAPDGSIERSSLVVRDLRQEGAEVARFTTAGPVNAGGALLSGETLFFTGDGAADRIAGIYAGSLADGKVRTLVEPGPVPAELGASSGSVVFALQTGPGVSRGPLVLSPSGKTLGSAVCGTARCTVELVDLSGGTVTRPLSGVPVALWLLSDRTLIGVDDTSVSGYDVGGGVRWALKDKRPQSPGYLTADGSQAVILYQDLEPSADNVVVLAAVDAASGAERELQRWGRNEPAPFLWAAVSTDETAVLIPNGLSPEAALDAGGGSFRADLVDLRTGTLASGALVVSAR